MKWEKKREYQNNSVILANLGHCKFQADSEIQDKEYKLGVSF